MYAAVRLQNGKRLAIPRKWVLRKKRQRETKIFLSKNENRKPNFNLRIQYFPTIEDGCYNGIYYKSFGKRF